MEIGIHKRTWSLSGKSPDFLKDKCRQEAKKTGYADKGQAKVVKSVALVPISTR